MDVMARNLHFNDSGTAVMRVAVSTWNGRVSPVFDVARTLLVLDVGDAGIVNRSELPLGDTQAGRIQRIADAGIKVLLCGAISRPLSGMLAARGVKVIDFISGEVEDVIKAYLTGALDCSKFAMPGCGGRRMRGMGCGRGYGRGSGSKGAR
jgi:predicted Fe-Mo cluster-binding NifX family protein